MTQITSFNRPTAPIFRKFNPADPPPPPPPISQRDIVSVAAPALVGAGLCFLSGGSAGAAALIGGAFHGAYCTYRGEPSQGFKRGFIEGAMASACLVAVAGIFGGGVLAGALVGAASGIAFLGLVRYLESRG